MAEPTSAGAAPANNPASNQGQKKRERGDWVGPLYFYDLIRLARRGRSILLRTCYALLLAGGLFFFYQQRFPHLDPFSFDIQLSMPVAEQARFAEQFVLNFMGLAGGGRHLPCAGLPGQCRHRGEGAQNP